MQSKHYRSVLSVLNFAFLNLIFNFINSWQAKSGTNRACLFKTWTILCSIKVVVSYYSSALLSDESPQHKTTYPTT